MACNRNDSRHNNNLMAVIMKLVMFKGKPIVRCHTARQTSQENQSSTCIAYSHHMLGMLQNFPRGSMYPIIGYLEFGY